MEFSIIGRTPQTPLLWKKHNFFDPLQCLKLVSWSPLRMKDNLLSVLFTWNEKLMLNMQSCPFIIFPLLISRILSIIEFEFKTGKF